MDRIINRLPPQEEFELARTNGIKSDLSGFVSTEAMDLRPYTSESAVKFNKPATLDIGIIKILR